MVSSTMACVSEKVAGHLETMVPDDILNRASQVKRFDTVARRTFGLNDVSSGQGSLTFNVLTNHAAVQVKATLPTVPSPDK